MGGSPSTAPGTIGPAAPSMSVDTPAPLEKTADKKARTNKWRERATKAQTNAVICTVEKISLFDSTKAGKWETAGTSGRKSMNVVEGGYMMSGINIGEGQREPIWTPEQLRVIRMRASTRLEIIQLAKTRWSVKDPDQEFVTTDISGSIVPTERAYVSRLDPHQYCIGTGPANYYDVIGPPSYYSDIVVADITSNWMINQWTSESVVIERVARNVLTKTKQTVKQGGRGIGHHFARVGLPKTAFGPLFHTMMAHFPGVMAQVSETEGYYWMTATWGVSSSPAIFAYRTESGITKTNNLMDVMWMLNGKSSLCLATLSISITNPAKMVDGELEADGTVFGLSVKLRNATGVEKVDYHGPPQQGSTVMVPSRVAGAARIKREEAELREQLNGVGLEVAEPSGGGTGGLRTGGNPDGGMVCICRSETCPTADRISPETTTPSVGS